MVRRLKDRLRSRHNVAVSETGRARRSVAAGGAGRGLGGRPAGRAGAAVRGGPPRGRAARPGTGHRDRERVHRGGGRRRRRLERGLGMTRHRPHRVADQIREELARLLHRGGARPAHRLRDPDRRRPVPGPAARPRLRLASWATTRSRSLRGAATAPTPFLRRAPGPRRRAALHSGAALRHRRGRRPRAPRGASCCGSSAIGEQPDAGRPDDGPPERTRGAG